MRHSIPRILFFFLALFGVREGTAFAQWNIIASSVVIPSTQVEGDALYYENGVLWAATNSLTSSTDGGKTWFNNNGAPQFTQYYDIAFFDAEHGALATEDGIFLTTDGGTSWSQAASFSCVKVAFCGSASTIGALNAGAFHVSTDAGQTWQLTLANFSQAFSFAEAPDGTLYLIDGDWSTQIGNTWVSTDRGQTWSEEATTIDLDAWTLAVDSCDSKYLYLADEQYWATEGSPHLDEISKLIVSNDGGMSWQDEQTVPAPFFSGSLASFSGAIYAGTVSEANAGIFRSTDRGLTWTNTGGPSLPPDSRDIAGVDNNTVFALDDEGNVWVTYNAGGDSVLESSAVTNLRIAPDTLFQADTLRCDSVTRSVSIEMTGCNPASILSTSIIGTDAASFKVGTMLSDSLPVTFYGSKSGAYHAALVFSMSNGAFDTVVLAGSVGQTQPLSFQTANVGTDTVGGEVSVPIVLHGLLEPDGIEVTLQFDTSLHYRGSFDTFNNQLDIPGVQPPGRAELLIPNANAGAILGYARFIVYTGAPADVTLTSLTFTTPIAPCEYALPADSATSIITRPSACGTIILSQFLQDSTIPIFTIRPNPTSGDVELISSLDFDNADMEIYDMLGIRRSEVTISLTKDAPTELSLPDAEGIYYVRIHTLAGIRSLSVVVSK